MSTVNTKSWSQAGREFGTIVDLTPDQRAIIALVAQKLGAAQSETGPES